MVFDRAIRGTVSTPAVPLREMARGAQSLIKRIDSGSLDRNLSALRVCESQTLRRSEVLDAIDQRSRDLLRGE